MNLRGRPRPWSGGVVLAVVLVAAAASTGASSTAGAQDTPPALEVPGTYVDELGPSGSALPPPGGVPLVVGAGSAVAGAPSHGGTILLTSTDEFEQYVQDPSPRLASGVAAFFDQGGMSLNVQLTPDETPASLTAGLAAVPLHPGVVDLVTVPSIGQLGAADHQQVAIAADALAAKIEAIVLLDPPDEVVTAASAIAGDSSALLAWADGLRSAVSAPENTMVFSSGLLDTQGAAVPAALAVAGLISENDRGSGPWAEVGGLDQPLAELTPVWSFGNDELGALEGAALNSFRDVAGTGTVLWGNLMLDETGTAATRTALGDRRVMVEIEQAMSMAASSVVFQMNDETTWNQVKASLTAYLADLWAAGGLVAPTAADAGSVEVGLGTTMTGEDILSGLLIVEVEAAIVEPGEYVVLSLQQEMQTS